MEKRKLSDIRISSIGKEYAIILIDYCLEVENYKDWDSNEYKVFIDKHYDDFVLTAIDEGIILPTENKYFENRSGDTHERIKRVAMDELKLLIKDR